VTGASSGIGEALARELAARGSDVVLVARRRDLLDQLARELPGRYGVRVEVLAADLTDRTELRRVEERARGGIDLLVNNAGVVSSGRFAELDVDAEERQVQLNVVALLRLTHAALPRMIARRHGAVLNVSSVFGFQPLPGTATYAAGKAFVTSFSESLAGELHGSGVTVTALCPGFVRTAMVGADFPVLALEADDVARAALDATERGRPLVVPSLRWKAIRILARHAPRPALRATLRRLVKSA
jgi:short-subunit dehydrogenase